MPSSSPPPPLVFSLLLLSHLHFLLVLLFSSSSPIYAASDDTNTTNSDLNHKYCVQEHLSALLQLKRGFGFSTYTYANLSSWNANHQESCCSWEGITCNTFAPAAHVIGLNLSGLRIVGVLDFSSLFHLRSLQRLDLSRNYFDSSPIPSGFGQLSNLTHLHLSGCRLYGQIPPDIFRLTRLVSLDLSYNQYYNESNGNLSLELESSGLGEVFGHLSSLRELNLDGVNMSAVGSQWSQMLAYAKNLRKLTMQGCGLSGPIHPSFSHLHLLTHLDLSNNNHISSPVPQFIANFTSLMSLSVDGCGWHGEFPKTIFSLPKLQSIDVSANPFLTIFLPKFSTNSTIQKLVMSGTKFHGNLADFLGNFQSLTELYIQNCSILGPIPQTQHVNLSQLVYLDLSDNSLQGPIPALIFDLTQLRYLSLSSTNLSGTMNLMLFQNLNNLKQLDLSDNKLSAVINGDNSSTSVPQSFVNQLSQLYSLDLSSNNFQGPIPRFIFGLTEIAYLDLSSNKLSGVVELGSFQNLKNLGSLDLSYNSFSAIINVRSSSTQTSFPQPSLNMSQLFYLNLANNNFQGPIPRLIFELTELVELDLSSNNFIDVMDRGLFQNFRKLRYLNLSYNSFTVINDDRSNSASTSLPKLLKVYLNSCNISKFPDVLRNQENMLSLDLSCNRISGKIPQWIWAVGNGSLEYLNLSNNALEGLEGSFPHLSLRSMRFLDLSSNMMKGSTLIPPPLSNFLSLANNALDGEVPSLICDAKRLQILDLSSNHFTGLIPQCLGEISDALLVLNLGNNTFGGPLLQTFKAGCMLKTLDLSDNELEGEIPKSLANCRLLTVLNLGNNHFLDTFPSHLANLPKLSVLVLRSNQFHGSIGTPSTSESRAFLSHLQIFDVSFNNLSGSLSSKFFSSWKMMRVGGPASEFLTAVFSSGRYYQDTVVLVSKGLALEYVKILTALAVVDLSHNQFHGDIPSSIGELHSLVVLNMSHNHFQGQIPPSLQNLRLLESLDLSQNSLSGKIPQQLSKLSFLGAVNLSENHLSGSIPQGGHFGTFQSASFLGNPGLCGPPLSSKCKEDGVLPLPLPPPSELEKQKKSKVDFMWMGFAVGHAVGFGVFFWTMVLWRKGRHAFFELVDRVVWSFIALAKRFGV